MASPGKFLERFPGPVTLRPSRGKWLLLFAISFAFSFGGCLMVRDGASGGWFVLIFFGFCTLISIVVMLPGASALTLDRDGFEVKRMYRGDRTRWRNASGFTTARLPPHSHAMVVYDDASQARGMIASTNIALTGRNAGLPDTFGMEPDDLATLMESWRQRAVQRR